MQPVQAAGTISVNHDGRTRARLFSRYSGVDDCRRSRLRTLRENRYDEPDQKAFQIARKPKGRDREAGADGTSESTIQPRLQNPTMKAIGAGVLPALLP